MEVAAAGDGLVRIRDSKDPGGTQIVISAGCWRRCLGRLVSGPGAVGECLVATPEGDWVLLRHQGQPAGAGLRFTPVEWRVFLLGARDGDFDLTTDGRFRRTAPASRDLREVLTC